jgi:hypothetical protein
MPGVRYRTEQFTIDSNLTGIEEISFVLTNATIDKINNLVIFAKVGATEWRFFIESPICEHTLFPIRILRDSPVTPFESLIC